MYDPTYTLRPFVAFPKNMGWEQEVNYMNETWDYTEERKERVNKSEKGEQEKERKERKKER